jgi:hypothetical protein
MDESAWYTTKDTLDGIGLELQLLNKLKMIELKMQVSKMPASVTKVNLEMELQGLE